jgi:hypothetical protein
MTISTLKKFDWMAVVFYPLAVILMEAFWVSPWLNWLGLWPVFRESRPVLSLGSVVLILALSLLVTRVALKLKMPMWGIQTIVIGSGLVAMLLVLGYEYADGYTFFSGGWFAHTGQVLGNTFSNPGTITAALPVFLYLWWRGINLGQSTTYFKDIYRTFVLGMVALIALIIIWQISSSSGTFPKPGAGIGANVIAFFFFGLIAIAICHLYLMRSTMPREEAALTSVWRWMPIMLGVIGGVVLVGFGIASALSPSFFDSVGQGASAIGHFLGKVINILIWPLNYLAEGIMWILRWLISLLRRNPPDTTDNTSGIPSGPDFGNVTPKELSPAWSAAIRWTVIAIVVGVIIYILARAVSRFRAKRAREEIEEVRESLFSWKGLRDDLKLFFNMMGQRFKRKESAAGQRFDENAAGLMDIREIYRHLQWEAGKSGIPRRRHETADEYAGRLRRYAPDSSVPVDDITRMYKNVRYGETSLPAGQINTANGIWQTLKGLLRQMRGG